MIPVPRILSVGLLVAGIITSPAAAQRTPLPAVAAIPAPPYAAIADLVLSAPEIVDATIRSTTRIKGAEAVNVAPGNVRLYVEADVSALIRGTGALPPRIGYLLDVPVDTRGKLPKVIKARVLLFARKAAGAPGQLQLVRPDAQRNWTPALDELTRRIVTEIVAADAPPAITGIGNAFHVPGALPGEGETQIFLTTRDNRPVSLSILRRPGEQRRWSVALSEVVDEGAKPPARDTLLWYRLACFLPPAVPASGPASGVAGDADAATARDDYRFVVESLGSCPR